VVPCGGSRVQKVSLGDKRPKVDELKGNGGKDDRHWKVRTSSTRGINKMGRGQGTLIKGLGTMGDQGVPHGKRAISIPQKS